MSPPTSVDFTKIKALTFDIYGTLIDWDGGIVRAARATSLAPFLPSDDDECLKALEAHTTRVEAEQPQMKKSEIEAEGLRAYAADLGLPAEGKMTKEEVEKAAKQFGGSIGSYEAFEDTVDAIQRLSKHFKVLVPLTNMDHVSYNGTTSGPLKGCPFTASYLAEDIGTYKPNLANFRYLFEHLMADYDIEQDDICHVAQSLFHDQEPSKKIGLRSVWVDRYGIFPSMGRDWDDVQKEFGMKGRVTSLGELADSLKLFCFKKVPQCCCLYG